ncbi:hypothetical protein HF086_008704 [Spodoptera exigua]|uniref:Uncharacterized protein n=1 Tax=Spodoptera exigua TaxID=7107 RepID=A0A922MVB3_SPOEX|nr:hypothetical protein HF086_008704 [Spodoptera exigua]
MRTSHPGCKNPTTKGFDRTGTYQLTNPQPGQELPPTSYCGQMAQRKVFLHKSETWVRSLSQILRSDPHYSSLNIGAKRGWSRDNVNMATGPMNSRKIVLKWYFKCFSLIQTSAFGGIEGNTSSNWPRVHRSVSMGQAGGRDLANAARPPLARDTPMDQDTLTGKSY